MVNASKILTVSYGTFSCTLEGFDDPFSTMKDISEYFRDLASEDRYFGAEPPKLDAEMLQRIAEHNTRGSVSAEMGTNAVTLRPSVAQAAETAADAAFEEAAAAAPDEIVEEIVEDVVAEAEPEVADAEPEIEETAPIAEMDDAVEDAPEMEETAIEAEAEPEVADTAEPEMDAPLIALVPEAEPLDVVEDEIIAQEAEDAADAAAEADDFLEDEFAEDAPEAEAEDAATLIEAATRAMDDTPSTETFVPAEALEDTSVADRLARIREVVALENDDSAEDLLEDSYSEDEHAEEISESAEDTIAALLAEDSLAPEVEDEIAPEADEAIEDDVSDVLAEAQADAEIDVLKATPPLRAIVRKVRKTEADVPAAEEAPAEAIAHALSPEEEAELQAELAEIEADSVPRRANALSSNADHDEAALERLFEATENKFDGAETSRAHANISHLKAAVAARIADASELDAEAPSDETEAYREDLASAVKPHRARIEDEAAPAEAPVAERRAPAAPLVLVSEQRVDAGLAEQDEDATAEDDAPLLPAGKVLPRRVRRALEESLDTDGETLASVAAAAPRIATQSDDVASDFEDFAAELGATELVDILEAAAAYSQLVQGRESFSRPKLLHLAMEADESFSREEGLRSFGQLLRNGTIKKIKRGAFELTRTSRYAETASKRAAG